MALSNLVLNVSKWTDRVVVDQTGLQGKFDWDLQWIPEDVASGNASHGPSLVGSLRDQAGLALASRRSPVDVLVVERVERPDPD